MTVRQIGIKANIFTIANGGRELILRMCYTMVRHLPGTLEERGIRVDGLAGILELVAALVGATHRIYHWQLAHARQVAVKT